MNIYFGLPFGYNHELVFEYYFVRGQAHVLCTFYHVF